MIKINKIIFEIITSPLGLPINIIWEYAIMGLIGYVSYMIGWVISPGGPFGSLIHWIVRGVSFILLWSIAYGVIAFSKWAIANPIVVAVVFIIMIVSGLLGLNVIKKKSKVKAV